MSRAGELLTQDAVLTLITRGARSEQPPSLLALLSWQSQEIMSKVLGAGQLLLLHSILPACAAYDGLHEQAFQRGRPDTRMSLLPKINASEEERDAIAEAHFQMWGLHAASGSVPEGWLGDGKLAYLFCILYWVQIWNMGQSSSAAGRLKGLVKAFAGLAA